MIVLPLNEEARTGRRTSWLTLVLVAACVAGFLAARPADQSAGERVDLLVDQAWAYFEEHPYVHVDESMAELMGAAEVAHRREAFTQELRRSTSPPIPTFVVQGHQIAFDRIVERIDGELAGQSFHRWGFDPGTLEEPDATLLTYALVHDDWLHLISNLVLLIAAGLFLEEVWGRAIFALFAVAGTAASAAGYALLDPGGAVLVGASGLVAALAGAFLVRFAATRIRFKYFYIPPFGGSFTARGWVVLPIYGALYLAVDHFLSHGAPGIEAPDAEFATAAHLAGLAFGAAFAALMKIARIEETFVHPRIEKKLTTRSNRVLDKALESREAGRLEEAVEMLAGEVARQPGDPDVALAFWDAASAAGRPATAVAALERVLNDEVNRGKRDLAIQHWRELLQRVPEHPLDAAVETRMVRLLQQAGERDLACHALRRVLDGPGRGVDARMLRRLARLAADLEPAVAVGAARRALASVDLEPAERAELEELLSDLGAKPAAAPAAWVPPAARVGPEASGSVFGAPRDLGASVDPAHHHAFDPSERRLDAGSGPAAPGVDEDGDTLNAPPFELDDLEGPTPSGGPSLELDGGARARGGENSSPGGVSLPPDPGDQTLPPLAEPDDLAALDDLDLDDDDVVVVSAEAEADLGRTIDLAELGARTLPADGAGPLDQTLEMAALGARTLQPGERPPGPTRELPDPEAATVPDYSVTASRVTPGSVPVLDLTPLPADEDPTLPPEPGAQSEARAAELPLATLEAAPPPALDPAARDLEPGEAADVDLAGTPDLDLDLAEAPDVGLAGAPELDLAEAPDVDLAGAPELDLAEPSDAQPAGALAEEPVRALRTLKRMNAIPVALGDAGLTLDVGERGKAELDLSRVEAVAVAGVRGLRPRPVVIVDLLTNWRAARDEPLKLVRLRSDRFDPRKLVEGEASGFTALKSWIAQLVERSGALPLPDATAVAGDPFRTFDSLEDYEREVLGAGS